jgi:hypothetical protein
MSVGKLPSSEVVSSTARPPRIDLPLATVKELFLLHFQPSRTFDLRDGVLELKPILDALRFKSQRKVSWRPITGMQGLKRPRGRPIDTRMVVFLGRLAKIYKHYTGREATVYKDTSKGDVRWGRFIAFVHACFLVAGMTHTELQLAKAWMRARTRVRSKGTTPVARPKTTSGKTV